ncbi:hypothetical protein M752DRAFT_274796 [Aspergillus phoenicis ATCC 13157]|uniref:Secreted protein n=1 Tax=Aspergillus phoenicis ATCC 13157 TaxID=1353007 RepID=A0A370PQJ7_ASPPH|nr:hypothetical protein M752DRAFT_274796 [Aspergillus phoenicis ATCC 13157]
MQPCIKYFTLSCCLAPILLSFFLSSSLHIPQPSTVCKQQRQCNTQPRRDVSNCNLSSIYIPYTVHTTQYSDDPLWNLHPAAPQLQSA